MFHIINSHTNLIDMKLNDLSDLYMDILKALYKPRNY